MPILLAGITRETKRLDIRYVAGTAFAEWQYVVWGEFDRGTTADTYVAVHIAERLPFIGRKASTVRTLPCGVACHTGYVFGLVSRQPFTVVCFPLVGLLVLAFIG